MGDVGEKEFFGVTKENTSECLQKVLREHFLEKGVTLEVVNMDMDKRIKGAVRSVAEDVPIVADKFHVIKYVNRIIDLCRIAVEKEAKDRWQIKRVLVMRPEKVREIQENGTGKWKYKADLLKNILKTHPEVKLLWDLKNKVQGFYRCKSLKSAVESWQKIHSFLDEHSSTHPEFRDLKKTFLNWEDEILNYFIFRTTNAYIEGLNNRIETLKRKKFGFRNKEKFLKSLCFMLFPISLFFLNTIFTHGF